MARSVDGAVLYKAAADSDGEDDFGPRAVLAVDGELKLGHPTACVRRPRG